MKKLLVLLFAVLLACSASASLFYPDYFIYVNADVNGEDINVNTLTAADGNIGVLGVDTLFVTNTHAIDINAIDLNVIVGLNVEGDANFTDIGVSNNSYLDRNVYIDGNLHVGNITSNIDNLFTIYVGQITHQSEEGQATIFNMKHAAEKIGAIRFYSGGTQTLNISDNWLANENLTIEPFIAGVATGEKTVLDYPTGSWFFPEDINAEENVVGSRFISYNGSIATGANGSALGINTEASGQGGFACGVANKVSAQPSVIEAAGIGSFAGGRADGSDATIEATNEGSFAYGYSTSAVDVYRNITSSGLGSVAMGYSEGKINSLSSGSIAMGYITSDGLLQASGLGSVSMGFGTKAFGDGAVALGYDTNATGQGSFCAGDGTIASGIGSGAVGLDTIASGDYSFVAGKDTIASGDYSLAMGLTTTASGLQSAAVGQNTIALGQGSFAAGSASQANGIFSIAFGNASIANGNNSFAAGNAAVTNGNNSFASGVRATTNNAIATAFGIDTQADGRASLVFGDDAQTIGSGSMAGGWSVAPAAKRIFAIGYGAIALGYADTNTIAGDAETDYGAIALGYNVRSYAEAAVTLGKDLNNFNANSVLVNDLNVLGNADIDGNLHLTDTVWDDVAVTPSSVRLPASGAPTWTAYKGGQVLTFAGNADNNVFFSAQLPHGYKEGTDIFFHIHYIPEDNAAGNVRWVLTCAWSNQDSVVPSQSVYASTLATPEVTDQHTYGGIGGLTGTGKTISSVLLCGLGRMASSEAVDTYDNKDIYLASLDFHLEVDTIGSDGELSK